MSAASERPPLGPAGAAKTAPSTGASVAVVPTDAALTREVVGLVADANNLTTVVKGKMARAIELLTARRERDPETFPTLFDEVMAQIDDRRRRSELRQAVVGGRDVAAAAAARKKKYDDKVAAAVALAVSVRTDTAPPTVDAPPTQYSQPVIDLVQTRAINTDPLAVFKLACDALTTEDDLMAAVKYLDSHVRKIITPEMRAADAEAKRKADVGEDEEPDYNEGVAEEQPEGPQQRAHGGTERPKPKAKCKGGKK